MSRQGKDTDWVFELKKKVPAFLNRLKGTEKEAFFHYSLNGDLYPENKNWGLGNTVFAAQIYHTLDMVDSLPENETKSIIRFIKSFQKSDGSIYDPLVHRKVSLLNRLYEAKNLDFSNFRGQRTRRAETRQSFTALQLLHSRPELPYLQIPYTCEEIDKYLSDLDWRKPYSASSHFSHLVFFLQRNREFFDTHAESADGLIDYAIDWANKLQSPEDGSWYRGRNVSISQKVNGAMKVITGLKAVDKSTFKYPEKLIDLCLSVPELEQACDSLDIIYVIHSASKITGNSYRYQDMQDFSRRWLVNCYEHYFPDIGGFSFYKHKANQYYYGAKLTRGLDEPDIHGTVLLLWGIALVAQILRIDKKLGFKEFIA